MSSPERPRRSPRRKHGPSLPNSAEGKNVIENNVEEKSLWKKMFDELCAFKAQNGTCHVSRSDEQNKFLGKWVEKQR
eukprot:1582461-Ditylum_brightwellii.AAC.1